MMEDIGVNNIYYNEPRETSNSKTKNNNEDKSFELTLKIPKKSMIDFGNKVGYRYCLHKTIKFGIGLSYLNYKTINNSHENTCLKWMNETDSHKIVLKKYATAKDELFIPCFKTKVISKENVGRKEVYDITIENTHNFLANGIVVHNCHGLPIEYEIEKKLGIKTTQEILDFGIGNYNKECENIVLSCKDQWKEIMTRAGRWVDFDNGYMTMSKDFMNSVWWVFSELYKKNRVYEGVKIMPYSTTCGTPNRIHKIF